MDQTLLFYTGIFVFSLMVTGLALTIWEFSRGKPHRQAREARKASVTTRPAESAQRM